MSFVLDASAAMPWCFHDETNAASQRLLGRALAGEIIHVPAHWPAEILNAATRALRRGRLEDPIVDQFLRALLAMNIIVDSVPPWALWDETQPLIERYRISAYDAAYLSLAKRLNVELATRDAQLLLAARIEGVALDDPHA